MMKSGKETKKNQLWRRLNKIPSKGFKTNYNKCKTQVPNLDVLVPLCNFRWKEGEYDIEYQTLTRVQ